MWLALIAFISDEFMEEIDSSMLGADFKLLVLSEEDRSGSFMGLLIFEIVMVLLLVLGSVSGFGSFFWINSPLSLEFNVKEKLLAFGKLAGFETDRVMLSLSFEFETDRVLLSLSFGACALK